MTPWHNSLEINHLGRALVCTGKGLVITSYSIHYTKLYDINLSFAQSMKKAKEIGIRQISGCPRSKIFMLFITESVFLTIVSFILAFIFLKLAYLFISKYDVTGIAYSLFLPAFIGIALTVV